MIGAVGELHPEVASRFGLDAGCAVFELDLGLLLECAPRRPRFQEVSRFPLVRRDLAVIVATDRPAGEIRAAIAQTGGAHLLSVEPFDRYQGRGVPEGRVSLAFRLVFQRMDRTLTDEEVGAAIERIVRMLERRFDGKLR